MFDEHSDGGGSKQPQHSQQTYVLPQVLVNDAGTPAQHCLDVIEEPARSPEHLEATTCVTDDREEEYKPVCSVQPRHAEGLKHNHNNEGQRGRVIIKHGHKVAPTALGERKAEQKASHAAENCNMEEKARLGAQ